MIFFLSLILTLAHASSEMNSCDVFFAASTPKLTRAELVAAMETRIEDPAYAWTIDNLPQLRRAIKWLHGRSHSTTLEKYHHQQALIEATVFGSVKLFLQKPPQQLTDKQKAFIYKAFRWFWDNSKYGEAEYIQLKMITGHSAILKPIPEILKKQTSRITSADRAALFAANQFARRWEMAELKDSIADFSERLESQFVEADFADLEFTNNAKHFLKSVSDKRFEQLIFSIFALIRENFGQIGKYLTAGGEVMQRRVYGFNFDGAAYRIVFSKKNGHISIFFIGSHEDYNHFFL